MYQDSMLLNRDY